MNDTAQEALVTATKALTKIEDHEAICAGRWRIVIYITGAIFLALVKVVLFPQASL